MTRKIKMKQLK